MAAQTNAIQLAERPMDPQTECRLLSLAPELRNRIYHEIFSMSTFETPVRLVKFIVKSTDRPQTVLAFLQTCRQIRHEAEGVFFAINHIATPIQSLTQPLSTGNMSSVRLASIRTLTVRKARTLAIERFVERWLSQMPELKVLTFDEIPCWPPQKLYQILARYHPEVPLHQLSRLDRIRHTRPHYQRSMKHAPWRWEVSGEEFLAFITGGGVKGRITCIGKGE
ncbi:hypothetical protein BDY17DRAFT_147301 [Neohortaea acidophila]|uniref:F-box domain-containing protein n=1 Tax=Neohortaea acidophila TaxID=245834 RepID=A0A6A6PUP0_9PEZI|nr:uncharacterized protein BDY17DRAFT_147301 [Neohortaea acidophila]KAF2483424.1 hypothetical protein BDY17DRAFT_147301 [Neohortaea acidophila]